MYVVCIKRYIYFQLLGHFLYLLRTEYSNKEFIVSFFISRINKISMEFKSHVRNFCFHCKQNTVKKQLYIKKLLKNCSFITFQKCKTPLNKKQNIRKYYSKIILLEKIKLYLFKSYSNKPKNIQFL